MAPAWAWGEGPGTPQGFRDDEGGFVRFSQVVPIDVGALTSKNETAQIQIDPSFDYPVRKIWFQVTADSTVTAFDVLAKVRDSSGYFLTDDYIQYGILNGVPLAKEWVVKAGDTIIVDLALADFAGTGNVYVQVFSAGAKRRTA